MRRVQLDQLVREIQTAQERERTPEQEAHDMMLARFGPSCAGWLVWAHRKQFHKRGAVDLKIPDQADVPPWFGYAVAFLRRRQGWAVDTFSRAGARTYRIRWLEHPMAERSGRLTRIGLN